MPKLIFPRLRISPKGKISLWGPFVKSGGLRISRSGPSYSQKVGAGTFNTRTGFSMSLKRLFPKEDKKGRGCMMMIGIALALGCCCLALALFGSIISAGTIPTIRAPAPVSISTDTPETTAIITKRPTWTPIPTWTEFLTWTPWPTITVEVTDGSVCICSFDKYNCGDFKKLPFTAHECFNYCKSIGMNDIHQLDGNNDGIPCQ